MTRNMKMSNQVKGGGEADLIVVIQSYEGNSVIYYYQTLFREYLS